LRFLADTALAEREKSRSLASASKTLGDCKKHESSGR